MIPQEKMPQLNALKESDKAVLMEGLEDILPDMWCDKIWEIIWKRWCEFEDFSNQR